MDNVEYKCIIAVATTDGIVVNSHFGRAEEFLILGLDDHDIIHRLETRPVKRICDGGNHSDGDLAQTAELLSDCDYVLVSRIGDAAARVLENKGIVPMEIPDIISEAVKKLLAYQEVQKLF